MNNPEDTDTSDSTNDIPNVDPLPILDASIGLIIGFYDRGTVAGYNINPLAKYSETVFGFNTHIGHVNSVSIDPDSVSKYFFSGGSDTDIRVYDRGRSKILTTLAHHTSDVTHLITTPHNLISGSRDGTICIWKNGDWILLKSLPNHLGGVSSMTLHPSYKILLSTDLRGNLFLWNILNGTLGTLVTNLKLSLIQFSPSGNSFAALRDNISIAVMDPATCHTLHLTESKSRITTMQYLSETVIIFGNDLGQLNIWTLGEPLPAPKDVDPSNEESSEPAEKQIALKSNIRVIQASLKSRIKDLIVHYVNDDNGFVITADSIGTVTFFSIGELLAYAAHKSGNDASENGEESFKIPKPLFILNTDQRIMSISVCTGDIIMESTRKKRTREETA